MRKGVTVETKSIEIVSIEYLNRIKLIRPF